MTADTVHDRIDRLRTDVEPWQAALLVAGVLAVAGGLAVAQESVVHAAMHDFRHAAGVTCH